MNTLRRGACEPANGATAAVAWWKPVVAGLGLYLGGAYLLATTGNAALAPTVLVLGAFLFPTGLALFSNERGALSGASPWALLLAFAAGGSLGSLVQQTVETRFLPEQGLLALLVVAFAEEAAKLAGSVWLVGRREYAAERYGPLFGAAAGAGFAAFETMGFGLTLLQASGDAVLVSWGVLARGLLAPLVHGPWAAIVAGVLWRERRAGRLVGLPTLLAFSGVVVLHALWEWMAAVLDVGLGIPSLAFQRWGVELTTPAAWLPLPNVALGLFGLWVFARLLPGAGGDERAVPRLLGGDSTAADEAAVRQGAGDSTVGMGEDSVDHCADHGRGGEASMERASR